MFNYLLLLIMISINFHLLFDDFAIKSIFRHPASHSKNRFSDQTYLEQIDCEEYNKNVSLIKQVAEGVVKKVWLGKWSSYGYVAVSFLKNQIYFDDFLNNIYMLRNFTKFNSDYTAKYLGNCENKILFTKFYRLGPLSNVYFLLQDLHASRSRLEAENCFQFCINYAKVIDYLHNSPMGRRVMCDSNDLGKLASQFLIDDDLSIVANDLDALPDATNKPIKCGNRLIGNLIAPEQQINSTYDHKIDIYKIPPLCNYFLSLCPRNDLLELLVGELHERCLNKVPSRRPSSTEVVRTYLRINYTVFN